MNRKSPIRYGKSKRRTQVKKLQRMIGSSASKFPFQPTRTAPVRFPFVSVIAGLIIFLHSIPFPLSLQSISLFPSLRIVVYLFSLLAALLNVVFLLFRFLVSGKSCWSFNFHHKANKSRRSQRDKPTGDQSMGLCLCVRVVCLCDL